MSIFRPISGDSGMTQNHRMLKTIVSCSTGLWLACGAMLIPSMTYAADDMAAAPVYDADTYPPSFEGQPDVGADAAAAPPAVHSPSLSLEERLTRLERQVKQLQQTDSNAKLNELHTTVQALQGQLEELQHQVQQMQAQQREQWADLDKRLAQLSASIQAHGVAKSPPPIPQKKSVTKSTSLRNAQPDDAIPASALSGSPVTAQGAVKPVTSTGSTASSVHLPVSHETQPNVAEEQQIYQTAYNLIKDKKYAEAASTLQNMLQKYPAGQFAANAHYWLGELYGLMGKNDQSATEFATVVNRYPDSPKVADAQLKLGLIDAAQFKWSEAKAAFKKVMSRYPGTSSAHLAQDQLRQIKHEGH